MNGTRYNINKIIFEHFKQEDICDICERKILYCNHSSSTYLCEGSKCDVALDYFIDDNIGDLNILLRLEKIKKIKSNIHKKLII